MTACHLHPYGCECPQEPCPVPFCKGTGRRAVVGFRLAEGELGFRCDSCGTDFYVYRSQAS